MHYLISDIDRNSEWVMFIHGLGGSTKTWKYQEDAFKGYNIVNIDLDGHGESEFVQYKNPQISSASAIHNLLEVHEIKKIHIVAMSLGTIVALEFMYMHPEMVESMVLAGCVVNLNVPKKILLGAIEVFKCIAPVKAIYPLFAKFVMPGYESEKSRNIFIRESKKMTNKSLRSWMSSLMVSPRRLKRYTDVINVKKIPVLFVSGNDDYLFVKGVKKLKYKIDNFNIKLIEKCGHVCSIEKANIFNKLALKFLKNTDDEEFKDEDIYVDDSYVDEDTKAS